MGSQLLTAGQALAATVSFIALALPAQTSPHSPATGSLSSVETQSTPCCSRTAVKGRRRCQRPGRARRARRERRPELTPPPPPGGARTPPSARHPRACAPAQPAERMRTVPPRRPTDASRPSSRRRAHAHRPVAAPCHPTAPPRPLGGDVEGAPGLLSGPRPGGAPGDLRRRCQPGPRGRAGKDTDPLSGGEVRGGVG